MGKKDKNLFMFKRFIECEKRRIDEAKWYEGEKLQKDPGNDYVQNWINDNAVWFREAWNISDCKDCIKWRRCGHLVKEDCENFEY